MGAWVAKTPFSPKIWGFQIGENLLLCLFSLTIMQIGFHPFHLQRHNGVRVLMMVFPVARNCRFMARRNYRFIPIGSTCGKDELANWVVFFDCRFWTTILVPEDDGGHKSGSWDAIRVHDSGGLGLMFLVGDFSGFVGEDTKMTIYGWRFGCLHDSCDLMKVGQIPAVLCDDL